MAVVVSVVEFGVSGGGDDDDERPTVVVVADGDTGGDMVAVAPRRGGRGGDTGGAHCLSHRFRRRYIELKALELYREERNTS